MDINSGLETKFARIEQGLSLRDGTVIEGYASRFGVTDQGGDVVARGAYGASLRAVAAEGRKIKMLWQHDPSEVIGVWDVLREDDTGLWVKGRLLDATRRGREAAALIGAGAIDGLSIGYRTVEAQKAAGGTRVLRRLELWEVSLVTFPMLPEARVGSMGEAKGEATDGQSPETGVLQEMAAVFEAARQELARG